MNKQLVTLVRIVFGIFMTLSGLNWWVKLTHYPSIADFITKPPPDDVLGALIETGFMFHLVKGTELFGGIVLLANRFVPLTLVIMFPVTCSAFLSDVFINTRLRGMVLGVSLMAAQVFLMLAYLRYYLPMMAYKADPGPQTGQSEHAVGRDALLSYFGWVSLAASSIALLWFLVMMFYHFAEWEYTFNPVMR